MSEFNNDYQRRDNYQRQDRPNSDNFFNNNNRSGNSGYRKPYGNNNGYQSRPKEPFDESSVRLYKAYAGTGNRETPPDVLTRMKSLAKLLDQFGYTLRVGGMDGPEEAFEAGVEKAELHLPWRDFNNRQSKSYFNSDEIKTIAKMFHPTFDGLKPAIQAFLCKNVRMVLGKDLKSPARFIVCWSEDGAETSSERTNKTGSIGHVISLAAAMKIPVFNLGKPDAESRLKAFLEIETNEREQFNEF